MKGRGEAKGRMIIEGRVGREGIFEGGAVEGGERGQKEGCACLLFRTSTHMPFPRLLSASPFNADPHASSISPTPSLPHPNNNSNDN